MTKKITTIPTHRRVSEPFRNWRGMVESGGRRIKQSLAIDQNNVRFLEPGEVDHLHRFALLADYLAQQGFRLAERNAARPERNHDNVNARRITNIGTFRAYLSAYQRSRSDISKEMFLLVRQFEPTGVGLPREIYGFTADAARAAYEGTRADIFDHLITILPKFGMHLFQLPTGFDVAPRFSRQPRQPDTDHDLRPCVRFQGVVLSSQ